MDLVRRLERKGASKDGAHSTCNDNNGCGRLPDQERKAATSLTARARCATLIQTHSFRGVQTGTAVPVASSHGHDPSRTSQTPATHQRTRNCCAHAAERKHQCVGAKRRTGLPHRQVGCQRSQIAQMQLVSRCSSSR